MAITVTPRGSGLATVSGSEWYCEPTTGGASASRVWVLAIAYDNVGGGGSDSYSSIRTNGSDTVTSRVAVLRDTGAAGAGVAFRMFEIIDPDSLQTYLTFGNEPTYVQYAWFEVDTDKD